MRFLSVCLVGILALGIVFVCAPGVYADRIDELERKIEQLERKIQEFEGRKAPERGFLSKKGVKVDVKGAIEAELVDVEDDNSTLDGATTTAADRTSTYQRLHGQIDKATLRFTITSEDENIGASTELELDEGETAFFDDAYIFIKGLELGDTAHGLNFGLQDRWIRPGRIFESYPVGGVAFWQDEEFQLIYGGEWEWAYWKASLANGLNLDDKGITEDTATFEILHDDRSNASVASEIGAIEWGVGGGVDLKTEDYGGLNLMGFYLGQQLQTADKNRLRGVTGYYSADDEDEQLRAGVNAEYHMEDFGIRGQYIAATDGNMDRWAAYVEPYYTFNMDYRYLRSITPAVQLSWYDVELENSAADNWAGDARTWGRQKYTFGAVAKINKNLQWSNEYSVNEEDTGADDDVDNNEFISQMKFSF